MDEAPPQIQAPARPKTSGMAIASLVCGLLGCLVLPALLGINFGIIAIRQIDSSGGALTGKCLAVGGLVVSGLMCMMIIFTPLGASLTGYIMLKKVDGVMEDIRSASVLTVDDQSVTVDDHNKTDDDNGTAANGNADAATKGGDGHGDGDSARENPLKKDNPEELVPIVNAADEAAANRSVVVNPKGSQEKRYIVVEVYMQRSEPKDTKFKERAGKKYQETSGNRHR